MQHLEVGLVKVFQDGGWGAAREKLRLALRSSGHHSVGERRFVLEVEVESDDEGGDYVEDELPDCLTDGSVCFEEGERVQGDVVESFPKVSISDQFL